MGSADVSVLEIRNQIPFLALLALERYQLCVEEAFDAKGSVSRRASVITMRKFSPSLTQEIKKQK